MIAPEEHVLEQPDQDKVRILVIGMGDPKAQAALFEGIRQRYGRFERVESSSDSITKYRYLYLIDGVELEFLDVSSLCASQSNGDWTKYLANRDAVLFIADLADYDEYCDSCKEYNDIQPARKNRMARALESWARLCNSPEAKGISKILILNQKDTFAEKILSSDIQDQGPFRDFAGKPKHFEQGVRYFIQKFKECEDCHRSNLYIRVTSPHDSANSDFILECIGSIIMIGNLQRSGLLDGSADTASVARRVKNWLGKAERRMMNRAFVTRSFP